MPRPKDRVKRQPAWWLSLLWVCDTRHHPSQGNLSLQSIYKLAEWAEWPVQWRTDMWSQHSRQHVHTHTSSFTILVLQRTGEEKALTLQAKKLQEATRDSTRTSRAPGSRRKTSRAIAGSRGLGQRLVAQSQREGALRAGRGDVTYKTASSMGTRLSVLVWGAVRGNPKEEGLLGTAAVKEQDCTKMRRPRF